MTQLTASDFAAVYLTGGDAGQAKAALAVDLTGCGGFGDRPAYEWAALVQPSRIDELLAQTGAEQVYGPVPWDGRPFGDGNGGTVGWPEGASAPEGDGMYEQAWAWAVRQ